MARRWKLLAVAALSAVVAGVVLWGQPPRSQRTRVAAPAPATTGPAGAMRAPASTGAVANHPGPTAVVDGVPMGYSHDEDGARAAAVTFVEMAEAVVAMDEPAAEAAQRAIASTAAADGLVADLRSKLAKLRSGWPAGTLTYRVAPVAVRVAADGPDRASAEVWYVGVVAGRNVATYESWATQSFQLVWERGDWRVASDAVVAGPRPEPGRQKAASAAELDARLAGFEAVR